MKKYTVASMLVAMALLTAGSALAMDASPPSPPLKTGKYRFCYGKEEECRAGKNIDRGNYLYFEKNLTGRSVFKYEETPFTWQLVGSTLEVTYEDDAPIAMEIRPDGAMLVNKKDGMRYMLVMDESVSFIPGMYFVTSGKTAEEDAKALDEFGNNYGDDEKKHPTNIGLYENLEGKFCPKEQNNCAGVKSWERKGNHITVTLADGKALNLTIERNTLINKATGERFLRYASEHIMRAAD